MVEVLEECLDCSLSSTGTWHCLDCSFSVPTIFLTQVACYVLMQLLRVFFVMAGSV